MGPDARTRAARASGGGDTTVAFEAENSRASSDTPTGVLEAANLSKRRSESSTVSVTGGSSAGRGFLAKLRTSEAFGICFIN